MKAAQLQVKLSPKANYIVSKFKLDNDLRTKEQAVNLILERHGVES